MQRRVLRRLVIATALVGLVLAMVPFIGSLAPSDKAEALVTRINVRELAPGTFVEADYLWSKIFALRDFDGSLYVYSVPFWNNRYWLPEWSWDYSANPCDVFGPDADGDQLIEDGEFRCQANRYDWMVDNENWTWTYDGRNNGSWVPDMRAPEYERGWAHIVIRHPYVRE